MRSLLHPRSRTNGGRSPGRFSHRLAIGRRSLAASVAAVALLAAACGTDDAAETAVAESSDGGPVLGAEIFEGQARTIDGDPFDLASLANKDLVVWFWAPW